MLVVQSSFTYKAPDSELTVRSWIDEDGALGSASLSLPACTASLYDESGVLLDSVSGSVDVAGANFALFSLTGITLQPAQHYTLIVSLRTTSGDPAGPRTYGVPVN